MKKKLFIICLAVLIITFTFFIYYFIFSNPKEKVQENNKIEPSKEDPIQIKINELLSNMTIEEKIAQMLVIYYTKDNVDENLVNILKNTKPGGFILMKDNITTFEKTKKFVEDLKSNSDIPLIISIDQEGGRVQRLQYFTDIKPLYIPAMLNLGNTNDEKLAYQVGEVMAEQLKTIGVNVDYSTVLDIYSNPNNTVIGNRSFGTNKEIVSKMALAVANGLEDNSIIPTYKHFPGHGDTAVDSHTALPIINKTYDELKINELIPFKEAIKNDAKIIMIGHLLLPSISSLPASLSKEIITDILKRDLGYKGLVITDALNMGALTKNYSEEEIYINAINAGCDLLLMPNGSQKAINIIKNKISEERINESVKKILEFKFREIKDYNLLDKSFLNNSLQNEIINKIPIND